MNERTLWGLVRDYLTVARITTALSVFLTPIIAGVSAKLAVWLASAGYTLDDTQVTVIFVGALVAVGGFCVASFRKFMDNRTGYETAMIQAGKEDLISGKSLKATKRDKLRFAAAPLQRGDQETPQEPPE